MTLKLKLMPMLKRKLRISKKVWIAAVLIAALAVLLASRLEFGTIAPQTAAPALATPGAVKVAKGPEELPRQADFEKVASTDKLELALDRTTGHFQVRDLRSGHVWHSYPDPADWASETQQGIWRTHLRSPVMFRYIDLNGKLSQPKDSNFLEEQGTIKNIALIPGGFRLTFDIPAKELVIPIEVKLENDSVVTTVNDSGLTEGALNLVWIRLYPFFGAEHSNGQDGYLFIPDGPGSTIPFVQDNANVNRIYQELVYGEDLAFRTNDFGSSRRQVFIPVFGIKAGSDAFLSVIEDGAEFAEIIASPSGAYSRYNWSTAQLDYRSTYKQVTNKAKDRFFITYNKEKRFEGNRSIRYMLLEPVKSGYVGMAERYRQYVIERYGLTPIKPRSDKLPMTVGIVGGEREEGLITDRYLKGTATTDAIKIVQRLFGLGVENMVVNYFGWQNNGFSSYGNFSSVDRRIGGNSGMKQFIQFAHTLDIPVYLQADYSRNTTRLFNDRRNGQRSLGGTVFESNVSLGYLDDVIERDIGFYRSLGADGVELAGLGRTLSSDYNTHYPSSREESRLKQQELFDKFRKGGLDVKGAESNIYVAPYVSAIDHLAADYSYDTFSDTAVPFLQIALHGLIPYTSQDSNNRTEFRKQFLRDLEYGANPSYVFTYEDGGRFKYAYDLHMLNTTFRDWETAALEEYQVYNEALGDVQDKFIVNHRTLAPQVKATTFEGGKRIIVNYGSEAYVDGAITVGPLDYAIVKGG